MFGRSPQCNGATSGAARGDGRQRVAGGATPPPWSIQIYINPYALVEKNKKKLGQAEWPLFAQMPGTDAAQLKACSFSGALPTMLARHVWASSTWAGGCAKRPPGPGRAANCRGLPLTP